MTEATETVDTKQVSKAKKLVVQRAEDIDLLRQVEADPGLFAADAADKLTERISGATREFDSLPQPVRVKAMTSGQLIEMVSGELEKAVKTWYPGAFATACKNLNVSEQVVAGEDIRKHSVSIMGHYDHKSKHLVKRPKLQRLVTLSRKGLS